MKISCKRSRASLSGWPQKVLFNACESAEVISNCSCTFPARICEGSIRAHVKASKEMSWGIKSNHDKRFDAKVGAYRSELPSHTCKADDDHADDNRTPSRSVKVHRGELENSRRPILGVSPIWFCSGSPTRRCQAAAPGSWRLHAQRAPVLPGLTRRLPEASPRESSLPFLSCQE